SFLRLSGVQVVYPAFRALGLSSGAVIGSLRHNVALLLLLMGCGVGVRGVWAEAVWLDGAPRAKASSCVIVTDWLWGA
ncbi:hypothetical protein AAGG49_22355, partial [Stenotrophomonas maltophilia]|uniref:hypothetical protein n=1 Tax=Stenotrophomonas maltophilia TaxID=40324 RepID=UPI00313C522E